MSMTCRKCGYAGPDEGFVKNNTIKSGRTNLCNPCCSEYKREWRRSHPERVRAIQAKSRARPEHKESAYRRRLANPGTLLVSAAKRRAKQKSLPYDLDNYRDQIGQRVLAGTCELTGIPIRAQGTRGYNTPSIDRIDPCRGYTYDNIRIVCFAMNCLLGNWGEAHAEEVAEAFLRRRKLQDDLILL